MTAPSANPSQSSFPATAARQIFGFVFALAASAAALAEASLYEQVVVTANPVPTSLQRMPASVYRLDQDALQRRAHRHISEALQSVPGANFSRGSGQEYLPSLRSPVLSGAGACGSVLAAENGVPLRAAGFCNVNELFEAHSEAARGIELLRGTGQTAYGSNAVHGVVNVLTALPGDPQHLGLEAGAEDFYRLRLGIDASDSLRATLTLAQDRGFRDASGYDQQKLTLFHSSEHAESWLSATHLDQDTAAFLVGSDSYRSESLSRQNPSPDAFRKAGSIRAASRIRKPVAVPRWPGRDAWRSAEWVLTPYVRHAEMDFLMHFLPGEPEEQNRQSSAGMTAVYALQGSTGSALQCGGALEYTDAALRQVQQQPTGSSAFLMATIPQGKHYDYEVAATQSSLFCNANWQAGRRWTLQAGLRYEHMHYDYDNRMLAGRTDDSGVACAFGGCRYSRPADRSGRFNNWSPFLGAVFKLAERQQLYANLSHGFRAPQATELYRLQREQQSAALDSEEMLGGELGIRGRGERWRYELAAFAYQKRDVIFRDSDFFNVSDGETQHRGIEFAGQYQPVDALVLGLSGSYASHRYSSEQISGGQNIDGNLVDTAPRHFGSAFVRWLASEHGWIELEQVHMSRYYSDPENANRYPGHDYWNLRGGWAHENWSFALQLINAADVRYAERADFTGFSGDRYFPGRPRTLFGELRYRLVD